MNRESALQKASEVYGIEEGYRDNFGEYHKATPEIQAQILTSLGVDCRSAETINKALEARFQEHWAPGASPAVVASIADNGAFDIVVPLPVPGRRLHVSIEWEDGSNSEAELMPSDQKIVEQAEHRARLRVTLPGTPRLGRHRVSVDIAGAAATETLWIVCPEQTYQPESEQDRRLGGVMVSLYGVRSGRNWGCGDFTDLKGLLRWAARDAGAGLVGLNPLHAIHNRTPYNTSPYLPFCTYYKNWIYLDAEAMEDFGPSARRLLASAEVRRRIAALRERELVDYEGVARLKKLFLRLAWRQFRRKCPTGTERRAAFDRFRMVEGPALTKYATYCALDEWIHRRNPDIWNWPDWPREYQDPESDATKFFVAENASRVGFYQYLQWQIELQLEAAQAEARSLGMPIGLFHDLALATDRKGCDLWADPEQYIHGCRVGAPPDGFSPEGQDWSFPPPNRDYERRTGYRLFAESIRKNARGGGALRIDHVMRLFRLYWIPADSEASGGMYVKSQMEDLLRILALESVRLKVRIIGEDLGTVPPMIREKLEQYGILGYRLLYFEKDGSGAFLRPEEYSRHALATVSTPDLPTLAGFWTGRDIEARRAAGSLKDQDAYEREYERRRQDKDRLLRLLHDLNLLPSEFPKKGTLVPFLTGDLHNAVTGMLAQTQCDLFVMNQEDLFKETEQQNLPGTTSEYPNWRRKMLYSIEQLHTDEAARGFTAMLRNWLLRSGRVRLSSGGAV